MFGLDVIFQVIFTVESFLTKVTLETIVEEAAALVDVTARDDIQAFTTNSSPSHFSKNHYPHMFSNPKPHRDLWY